MLECTVCERFVHIVAYRVATVSQNSTMDTLEIPHGLRMCGDLAHAAADYDIFNIDDPWQWTLTYVMCFSKPFSINIY